MKTIYKINNWVLFFLAISIPFLNSWKIGGHSIANFTQITIILLLYYFVLVLKSPLQNNPYKSTSSFLTIFLFLFTLSIVFSLIQVEDIKQGFTQFFNYLQILIIYIILSEITFYDNAFEYVIKGLYFGFLISVFISIMQYFGFSAFNLFTEDQLNSNTTFSSNESELSVSRIWGPFGNSLTFSLYLSVVGLVLYVYFKYYKNRKLVALFLLILTLLCIGLTISRMALFAFGVSLFIMEFIAGTKKYRIIYLGLLLVLFFSWETILNQIAGGSPLLSRINNSQDDLQKGRLELWEVGYQVWKDNIFFGSGPGNLAYELYHHGWNTSIDKIVYTNTAGHVENFYLTVLFTFGLVPFLFYFLFFLKYNIVALSLFYNSFKNKIDLMSMILFPGFLCFFINNLINPALNSDQRIQLLFIFLLVLTNIYYKKSKLVNSLANANYRL
ncbi:O-antigen ligase family protein [Adhaeribacter swui]|uniref:O-antigen ligase family protein n=1 Tax=Adhaeribacter swui TaxID=2086471 RepID=A0A7G7G597_9BACT|nr:O-antigen ligase family protein [Adhaeribacter swui]QNF32331.1 O-antigen ligase family protein [Adhaeribacter swui]